MRHFLIYCLALASCAASEQAAQQAAQARTDSALTATLPGYTGRKVKFTGPVNITYQNGTGNTANATATDKVKAQAAAVGPNAQAAATKAAGPGWKEITAFGLVCALLGVAGWEYVSHLNLLAWLPWRVKPG